VKFGIGSSHIMLDHLWV